MTLTAMPINIDKVYLYIYIYIYINVYARTAADDAYSHTHRGQFQHPVAVWYSERWGAGVLTVWYSVAKSSSVGIAH